MPMLRFMVPLHARMREQATHARLEADVGVGQARRTLIGAESPRPGRIQFNVPI